MPINKPTIQNGLIFTDYGTREDYKADTREEPPPYNYDLPKKTWRDKTPKVDAGGNASYKVPVYVRNIMALDSEGQPLFTRVILSAEQAKTVNIPPQTFQAGPTETHPDRPPTPNIRPVNEALGQIPVPIRELEPGERWGRGPGIFGAPQILSIETAAPATGDGPGGEGTALIRQDIAEIKQMLIRMATT